MVRALVSGKGAEKEPSGTSLRFKVPPGTEGRVVCAFVGSGRAQATSFGLFLLLLSVIFSPSAILWGKRPVYLGSAILFISTSLWAAWSPSFSSLLAVRVFQGVAVSPVECLPSATIAEIFFLHERAYRIGIYTLLLLGGKNLVPLVSAAIIGSFRWRWVFCLYYVTASHVGFAPEAHADGQQTPASETVHRQRDVHVGFAQSSGIGRIHESESVHPDNSHRLSPDSPKAALPASDEMAAANSPYFTSTTGSESNANSFKSGPKPESEGTTSSQLRGQLKVQAYTHNLRQQPPKSFTQQLRPWHGRLNNDNWFKVMARPFILFAYPAVLWSSAVYACSVGWLIVISESIAMIYRDPHLYNFDALQTGLVYISPFVGGILGTGVAGKVSDIIVRAMARRNGGLYEPEFRLVMAATILVTTCVGLMGFGWSAEEKDHWMVPTIFFGAISFGCSLGSTTAITFCVDKVLVTLNFSKNVLHGLRFSLADGAKMVYIWIGIIQLLLMLCQS
ncbi:major facilitator superfamily domain-containing protein [Ilyonectria sp. MPI-CAGE-AT-0026]|nr:major facilitator superfamily domain-containing protein [Ilyonectria sp. MPI-CAGE-AT-0026]